VRQLIPLSRDEHLRAGQLLREVKANLREVLMLLARSQGLAKADRVWRLLNRIDASVSSPLDDAWCRSWAVHDTPYYGAPPAAPGVTDTPSPKENTDHGRF
jgi:hypothetical protein